MNQPWNLWFAPVGGEPPLSLLKIVESSFRYLYCAVDSGWQRTTMAQSKGGHSTIAITHKKTLPLQKQHHKKH